MCARKHLYPNEMFNYKLYHASKKTWMKGNIFISDFSYNTYHTSFLNKHRKTYVHKAQDGTVARNPPALKHEVVGSEAVEETLTTSMFLLESRDGEGESWRDLHGFSGWTTFHPCSTTSIQLVIKYCQTMQHGLTYSPNKHHKVTIIFGWAWVSWLPLDFLSLCSRPPHWRGTALKWQWGLQAPRILQIPFFRNLKGRSLLRVPQSGPQNVSMSVFGSSAVADVLANQNIAFKFARNSSRSTPWTKFDSMQACKVMLWLLRTSATADDPKITWIGSRKLRYTMPTRQLTQHWLN